MTNQCCGLAVIFCGFIALLIGRETMNIPDIFSGVHGFTGKTVIHHCHYTMASADSKFDDFCLQCLTNRMWFSVVYSLTDNDTRHHNGQNVVGRVSPQQILTTVMTRVVVDKTIHHAKPHSIYFLPQYQSNLCLDN